MVVVSKINIFLSSFIILLIKGKTLFVSPILAACIQKTFLLFGKKFSCIDIFSLYLTLSYLLINLIRKIIILKKGNKKKVKIL